MFGTRIGRLVVALVCAVYLPLSFTPVAYGASISAEYKSGYSSFTSLVKDERRARYRSNWKQLEERFMRIYKRAPKGAHAPKALYFTARVNEELAKRSFLSSDYQSAVEYFRRVASRFPKHSWSDDSLYRSAQILHEHLHDDAGAVDDLNTILREYTRGDMYAKALSLHRSIRNGAAAVATSSPRPAAEERRVSSSRKGLAELREIRFQSSNEYTRIVLDMTRETDYHYQILSADAARGLPFRLYVDLSDTSMGGKIPSELNIADGILNTVRTGSPSPGVSRVVLDFDSVQKYNVFALENPYRVVIDVTAPKDGEPSLSASKGAAAVANSGKQKASSGGNGVAARLEKPRKSIKYTAPPGSKDQVGELIEQLGLTVKTIMIDAGHGGKDPGAMANSIKEKLYVLKVAKMVGERLKRKGYTVLYTRSDDTFVPLEERTAMANVRKADMFISFHINAHRSSAISGVEIYYLNLASSKSAVRVAARENAVSEKRISDLQFILTDLMLNSKMQESKDLASLILTNMLTTAKSGGYSVRDNGVRSAPFYVLMGAKMPSVLVELGYCTNKSESSRLKSEKYLTRLADGIVKGVEGYTKQLGRFASM